MVHSAMSRPALCVCVWTRTPCPCRSRFVLQPDRLRASELNFPASPLQSATPPAGSALGRLQRAAPPAPPRPACRTAAASPAAQWASSARTGSAKVSGHTRTHRTTRGTGCAIVFFPSTWLQLLGFTSIRFYSTINIPVNYAAGPPAPVAAGSR